jgi:hypothetical protein
MRVATRSTLAIFEAYAICMVGLSPIIGVQASFPAKTFDELNNIQRNSNINSNSNNAGVGAFAADGTVTLLIRTSSETGKQAAAAVSYSAYGKGSGMLMQMDRLNTVAINVLEGSAKETMAKLMKQRGIEGVEMETEVHALPSFPHNNENNDNNEGLRGGRSRQRQLAESLPYGITMVQSDALIQRAAGLDPPMEPTPRKICVIDTGYGLGHPDLPNTSLGHNVTGFNPYDTGSWNVDGHG